jgi:hypothetical protein
MTNFLLVEQYNRAGTRKVEQPFLSILFKKL